ncbi:Asparagine synthetase B [glutamine-hydrolyzing] [subsurface metagenome]
MSGIAVACSNSNRNEVEAIMQAIAYRGPYASAIHEGDQIILAQNYLQADGAVSGDGTKIPVRSSSNPNLMIGYDGQMGNWADLAGEHNISHGPFAEERLLLALYEKYGKAMLKHLTDATFSLVITDGKELFAARDVLGIKTLFYGWKDKTLYLASELKGILQVTKEVYEFPNGHYMDSSGQSTRFDGLPKSPPKFRDSSVDIMAGDIREIIERSFRSRVDFSIATGGLLSGGMDSSVINYLASQVYKEKFGQSAKLRTFAIGVGESEDIHSARLMASYIDSEHYELKVSLKQMLEVLPEVIYYLESFDPSLVRSSVTNYLMPRYAKEQGIQILLSGEGGDEVFCGYKYLGHCTTEELFAKQMECISFLHNNASLRLDRMNMCHSIRVITPLISGELLRYSMAIPPQYKQMPEGSEKIEKWIFRKAYENLLPESIVWRSKQEFSQGSGSARVLPAYFEEHIPDDELAEAQARYPIIRSKEELYYFRLFTKRFGADRAVSTVGQWHSL